MSLAPPMIHPNIVQARVVTQDGPMPVERVMWEENHMPEFRTRHGHGHVLRTQIRARSCRAGLVPVIMLNLQDIAELQ